MKTLLVNNRLFKANGNDITGEITEKLSSLGVQVIVDDGTDGILAGDVDNILVLGGDGTLLRAARAYGCLGIPILGINMGTVGFLSNIEINEIEEYIPYFLRGDYILDRMMMLEVDILRDQERVFTTCCLNEVVIKSGIPRMLSFDYNIDRQQFEHFRGDGLIFATPTGSTAYSRSAGGPIVDVEIPAIIITALAAYTANSSPRVVSAHRLIEACSPDWSNAVMCVDGQVNLNLQNNDCVLIKKADRELQLINLKKTPFFYTLNQRLLRSKG